MANEEIAAAFERTERVLRQRPSAGRHADEPAVARWEGGLRLRCDTRRGEAIVTDLPRELGGENAGPSPGWLVRAGLAACLGVCIAAVAAREGVELSMLEVEAHSNSDVRGLFGLPNAEGAPIDPGPEDIELSVRIAAPGVSAERLGALVRRAQAMSPVAAALQTPRPVSLRIGTGN